MPQPRFERAILYTRKYQDDGGINETLQRLIVFLKNQNIAIAIDAKTEAHVQLGLPTIAPEAMHPERDLIIVVGGDGNMLSAARMAVMRDIPITGISRGRLGFLTDIAPHALEEPLKAMLNGDYKEEKRRLLTTKICDAEQTYFEGIALNDVVLSRGKETHLIEFDVSINQQFVSHYRADGLIVATSTGSTAYALSAGGPIMHPELDAIVMVPMFSHSLNTRPLVFPDGSDIEIDISLNNEHNLHISCDSQKSQFIKPGQKICINRYPQQVRHLHPLDYNYYDTLRRKLGWGFKPQG